MSSAVGTRYKKSLYSRYFSPRTVRSAVLKTAFRLFPGGQSVFGYYTDVQSAASCAASVLHKEERSAPPQDFGVAFTSQQTDYMRMREEPIPELLHTSFTITEHHNCVFFGHSGAAIDKGRRCILAPTIREAAPRNYLKARLIRYRTGEDNAIYIPMMGIHKGHRQYFHFLGEYLVELWMYLDRTSTDITPRILVTRNDISTAQQEMYAAITAAFPYVRIVNISPNDALICPRAHIPCYLTEGKTGVFIPQEYRAFLAKILTDYYNLPPARPHRSIYLSRTDAKLRRITNEDDFLPMLRDQDYTVVTTAGMTLREQFTLFRDATSLITTHGAGMINLLFMPKSARVVEIAPYHFGGCAFIWISMSLGITHRIYRAGTEGKHQAFECDANELLRIVEHT